MWLQLEEPRLWETVKVIYDINSAEDERLKGI